MKVKFYGSIAALTGEKERDFTADDVKSLLNELYLHYPKPFQEKLFEGDALKPGIVVLKNGKNINNLQGLETPLAQDDQVSIFPVLGGG